MLLTVAFSFMLGACIDTSSDVVEIQEIGLVPLPSIEGGGPGQAGFGRIADLELGEDGYVYVLDELSRTIRVFDQEGVPVRTFGSRGQGPGEFEGPTALAWDPEGHLWVVDPGNARLTVFEPDGGLIATYPTPDPFFYPLVVGFSESGHLYRAGMLFEGGGLENPKFLLIESVVGDGRLREVRRVDLPFVQAPSVFEVRGDEAVLIAPIPFSSEPVFRLDADGRLWYAQTREPWVHRWTHPAEVQQTLGREFRAPAVTSADRQEILEREEIVTLREKGGPAAFAEFLSLIPKSKPHLHGFFFDDQGNVWIIRSEQDDPGEGALPLDVYGPAGTLIATARAAFEPEPRPRIRDGFMVGVTRNELGVESVAMYRIQR